MNYVRGYSHVAFGKLDDALRDLNFAYELDPRAKRTLLYLGDVYQKAENGKKALEFYDKAIVADGKYDDAYARKASLLAKTGKHDEAIAAIDQAIAATSYKPERFWVQKGDILDASGKSADAAECYVKARTISPRLAVAWKKEALVLKKLGNAAGAKAAATAYLELVPTDEEFKSKDF